MEQGKTDHPLTHETLFAWYVWIDGKRKYTWAASLEAAREKTKAERIEPAPPLVR